MANLRAIDVNLVVALDALLHERSVSRAAARIGLSQPAMSHALAKLREIYGDPLLVRVGRAMTLTERAEVLAREIGEVIERLEGLFSAAPAFDPAASTRSFRLAATDYVQLLLLPVLDRMLASEAPCVSVAVQPLLRATMIEALRVSEIDLAIGLVGPGSGNLPEDIHTQELFRDRFVGLARKGHPALRKKLDIERYAALSHVLVSPRGTPGGVVDTALARQGLSRRVAMIVPSFLVVPHIVAHSDHVATLAERVTRPFTEILPLVTFTPPIPLEESPIGLVWHRRTDVDPAHAWLRAAVRRALGE